MDFLTGPIQKIVQNWHSFSWLTATVIFGAYILIDMMAAKYTFAVTKRKAVSATNIGSMMYFLMGFGVLNYVDNFLYLFVVVAGSWIGTYIVVNREKKNDEAKSASNLT